MKLEEVDRTIEILKVIQYCWADQVAYDGQKIADYDAIDQVIECLKSYKASEERLLKADKAFKERMQAKL